MTHTRGVFLDRDGVINDGELAPCDSPADFQLLPGTAGAIRQLNHHGYAVFVVTNQGGVGCGYLSEADLEAIHQKMLSQLSRKGAKITDIRACIHEPKAGCRCRKPKPGMLLDLIESHAVDPKQSWMVGDRETDVMAGRRAGLQTVRIGDEQGTALAYASDLKQAVEDIILPSALHPSN